MRGLLTKLVMLQVIFLLSGCAGSYHPVHDAIQDIPQEQARDQMFDILYVILEGKAGFKTSHMDGMDALKGLRVNRESIEEERNSNSILYSGYMKGNGFPQIDDLYPFAVVIINPGATLSIVRNESGEVGLYIIGIGLTAGISHNKKKSAISETFKRHNCCNPRHDQCLTASLQCTKTSRNLTWDIDITNSEKNHVRKGVQGTKSTGSIFHDFNNPVESLGNGIG